MIAENVINPMKIFLKQPSSDSNEFGCFRNDYTMSLNKSMNLDSFGLYHSFGVKVDLDVYTEKNSRLVQSWDFGYGNILHLPQKIIECKYLLISGVLYIAYTYATYNSEAHDGSNRCNIYLITLNLNTDSLLSDYFNIHKNIFNSIDSIKLSIETKGDSGCLTVDKQNGAFLWKYIAQEASSITHSCKYAVAEKSYSIMPVQYKEYETINLNKYNTNRSFCEITDVNDSLYVLVIKPKSISSSVKHPAITICLGGPKIDIPNSLEESKIIDLFSSNGYYVIIPLRRGVIGISQEWEDAIDGKCGTDDTLDIIKCTQYVVNKYNSVIDINNIGVYGASYGGFSTFQIAGKYNKSCLFKAMCSHCGVFDLATHPFNCHGNPHDVMAGYIGECTPEEYFQKIINISPSNYVEHWRVPMLIIHTLDDSCIWFGQSVKAYNMALAAGKSVRLILGQGGHTYDTPNSEKLLEYILHYFDDILK